jgi:hypothetical protein
MDLGPPAPVGSCPAGEVALSGGPNPTTCYRKTDTAVTITSAAVSKLTSLQPPAPAGQPKPPVQYGFWITLPSSDSAALNTVITTVSGPQTPQDSQGAPAASTSTSALTISVAGHTWVLVGFATADTGRAFKVFLSSSSQALQLQRALGASS